MNDSTVNDIPPFVTTEDRDSAMIALRKAGVPDRVIAHAFRITRQRVHARIGPRPIRKRKPAVAVPKIPMADLPDYLKSWRERNGLSMAQAARMCGISSTSWFCWESGRTSCAVPGLLLRYLVLLEEKREKREIYGPEEIGY